MTSHLTPDQPPRPIPTARDLRTMVTDHLQHRCLALLESAEGRRHDAFETGHWAAHSEAVRQHVREAFGDMPFGARGAPLNLQPVSSFDLGHCRVENVLFDSFRGWQVNGSVFVPPGDGPFPAVVIPVGHSGKQFENYQVPAQAFASLGFVAIAFDPPGQASEKQQGNDHFVDGVRTFLTGHSANRYFILDALRCIDYLETRADVDMSRGVGMTGVSGGGHTTLFSTLFDDRITCQGPSCCVNRMADHPVGDLYSPCPEAKWSGRIAAGVDELDVLLAGIPTPTLYMAGERDEVFRIEWSRVLAHEAATCFSQAGVADRFQFFEDVSGHAYTLAQVRQFTAWMNRWILGEADRVVPELDPADFPMMPYDQLKCHPAAEQNIFTLNRAIAQQQVASHAVHRTPEALRAAVTEVVGSPGLASAWEMSASFQVWSQTSREVLVTAEGLDMPATWLEPMPEYARDDGPVLVLIDDAGRRAALESWNAPARLSRMLERDTDLVFPTMLVPDLPGWGDTTPALVPYAMAGWGSMDRLTAYLSCTMGDGILAIRTRCAVAIIDHLIQARGIEPGRIVMIGRGLGGPVALMAGALCSHPLRAVATWSGLVSFLSLAEADEYDWPAAGFLPDVLAQFDLPDLVRGLDCPVAVLNPLDAMSRPLSAPAAEQALGGVGESVVIAASCDDADAVLRLQELIGHHIVPR
ncbi:MAG: hypothetical protein HN712_03660 [Gemmatimonadetes bacterium]|jgi:cephalosporin-C deacetylase-like acetyl esterase|nr:hypothetical protein [Gemmatimonadota bacterium]MBT7859377.1 hypothetical protein [Gemmatimonadota bacterium]